MNDRLNIDTQDGYLSWLCILRNEYITPWRHCVAIIDDFGDLVPVSSSEHPINYHFCGWQYTQNGIIQF